VNAVGLPASATFILKWSSRKYCMTENIHPHSLSSAIDTVNAAWFDSAPLTPLEKTQLSHWIAGQQIRNGHDAGAFAPAMLDYEEGARLFTGELLNTRLAMRNILTAEAARALVLLNQRESDVIERTAFWLSQQCFSRDFCAIGECAHSGVAVMRFLSISNHADAHNRLLHHIEVLAKHRDERGRWHGFPFFYTLLALTEIDLPQATDELCYSRPACQHALKRLSLQQPYTHRRQAVLQRALSRCILL
jgi:hypothetical protein